MHDALRPGGVARGAGGHLTGGHALASRIRPAAAAAAVHVYARARARSAARRPRRGLKVTRTAIAPARRAVRARRGRAESPTAHRYQRKPGSSLAVARSCTDDSPQVQLRATNAHRGSGGRACSNASHLPVAYSLRCRSGHRVSAGEIHFGNQRGLGRSVHSRGAHVQPRACRRNVLCTEGAFCGFDCG